MPLFVPVVPALPGAGATARPWRVGSIAIEIAGVVVRVEAGVDLGLLRDVVRTVKAAT